MKRTLAILLASIVLLTTNMTIQAQSLDSKSTAKVIFYRSSDDGGKAYALTSQNRELTKLKKGEQFEQTLAPGTYYYMADPSTKQVFRLDLVAGQVLYVKASRDGNFFNGQPSLQISNAGEYQQNLAKAD
jgi:hypothetical protein